MEGSFAERYLFSYSSSVLIYEESYRELVELGDTNGGDKYAKPAFFSGGPLLSSWGESRLSRSICRDNGEGDGDRVLETPDAPPLDLGV
jgi:hypothetical protein